MFCVVSILFEFLELKQNRDDTELRKLVLSITPQEVGLLKFCWQISQLGTFLLLPKYLIDSFNHIHVQQISPMQDMNVIYVWDVNSVSLILNNS